MRQPVIIEANTGTSYTIVGASNSYPCVFTLASRLPLVGGAITISNFTLGWAGANGNWTATNDGDGHVTVAGLDSTHFGAPTPTL